MKIDVVIISLFSVLVLVSVAGIAFFKEHHENRCDTFGSACVAVTCTVVEVRSGGGCQPPTALSQCTDGSRQVEQLVDQRVGDARTMDYRVHSRRVRP